MKKRFELRRQTAIPIEVITSYWDEPVNLKSGDLSPRGTYIYSNYIPDMGEHVICSFSLGKKRQYDFFGKVVQINLNRRESDTKKSGFAIEFLDSKPIERINIRKALKGTPPPSPVMRKIRGKSKAVKQKQRS